MVSAASPSLFVFTFKEGMLARLGHDLRLSATRFDIAAEQGRVRASVDLDSLTVDGAIKGGVLDGHELDDSDREKILAHARDDVLDVARYPAALFEASVRKEADHRFVLNGTLQLHGVSRPLEALVELRGPELVVSSELKPSDWGIAPFRALAGAIRVKDLVRIELHAAVPVNADRALLAQAPLSFRSE